MTVTLPLPTLDRPVRSSANRLPIRIALAALLVGGTVMVGSLILQVQDLPPRSDLRVVALVLVCLALAVGLIAYFVDLVLQVSIWNTARRQYVEAHQPASPPPAFRVVSHAYDGGRHHFILASLQGPVLRHYALVDIDDQFVTTLSPDQHAAFAAACFTTAHVKAPRTHGEAGSLTLGAPLTITPAAPSA